jgi:hypothetical protein
MAYSDTQIQAFRDELATLRDARTKLLTGRLAVKVVIDGDVAEYHRINIPYLNQRIGELESILSAIDSPGTNCTAFHITTGKAL